MVLHTVQIMIRLFLKVLSGTDLQWLPTYFLLKPEVLIYFIRYPQQNSPFKQGYDNIM